MFKKTLLTNSNLFLFLFITHVIVKIILDTYVFLLAILQLN